MTDPTAPQPAPVSVQVDKILDGFRAALAEYAGAATARALERAIVAEATRDTLLEQRGQRDAGQKAPDTTTKED